MLQIVADLHQYSSASESLLLFRFSCMHLPSRQLSDPAVEDPLFDSSQLSGLWIILVIKAGSRTFNQSIISLTIHTVARGILTRRLIWKRHRIANKIHLLDFDAWMNVKLQWQRSGAYNRKSGLSDSDISNRPISEFPSQWVELSLQCCSINSSKN